MKLFSGKYFHRALMLNLASITQKKKNKTLALLNFGISLFSNEAKAKIDDILVSIVLVYYPITGTK